MALAPGLAYLDASAFLKLVLDEPESEALDAALDPWRWTSSALLEVEATLGVRRRSPMAVGAVRALLGTVNMADIDADIRRAAGDLTDPGLRTLDAIHLATALSLGKRCGAFFSYDDRLVAAARAHGLTVSVPQP
jgi:predicted nucleic acid-binding protein